MQSWLSILHFQYVVCPFNAYHVFIGNLFVIFVHNVCNMKTFIYLNIPSFIKNFTSTIL